MTLAKDRLLTRFALLGESFLRVAKDHSFLHWIKVCLFHDMEPTVYSCWVLIAFAKLGSALGAVTAGACSLSIKAGMTVGLGDCML